MRDEKGQLHAGVSVGDMGIKTIGNDLDNAHITFNRYGSVMYTGIVLLP